MNQDERDDEQLILMLKYIERLEYAVDRFGDEYSTFLKDITFQDSCSLCFIQIGEAVNRLSDFLKEENSDVSWSRIYGLRCHLVHGYELFDAEIVWDAIDKYIPQLKDFCLTRFNLG